MHTKRSRDRTKIAVCVVSVAFERIKAHAVQRLPLWPVACSAVVGIGKCIGKCSAVVSIVHCSAQGALVQGLLVPMAIFVIVSTVWSFSPFNIVRLCDLIEYTRMSLPLQLALVSK